MPAARDALSEALDEALELDASEHGAYFDRLRKADAALAAEVQRLLAVRGRAEFEKFLAGSFPAPVMPEAGREMIGRQVGAYRIEAEIGSGALGTVWRARRTGGRGEQTVVLKFVHAAATGQAGEGPFQSEARRLQGLRHAHIARLLEAGLAEGLPYLMFEYIEGEPLDQYCEHRALPLGTRCRLFLQVLEAVDYAHSHLILHRDLEPSNVRVTSAGEVKLLDCGIAKLLELDAEPERTRWVARPAEFAAPEQRRGQPLTVSSDIYALGLLLQSVLTGVPPASSEARSRLDAQPCASRTSSMGRARRRALEGGLDAIIAKALRESPEARYSSVEALAQDLERHLAQRPLFAMAQRAASRAGKFARRPARSVVLAALAVAALASAGVALWQAHAARRALEAERQAASSANAQSELTEFLLDASLTGAAPEALGARLEQAHTMIDRRFANDPHRRATLLVALSVRFAAAFDSPRAATLLDEAEAISRTTGDAALVAQIVCGRAEAAAQGGDLVAARRFETEGLENLRRVAAAAAPLKAVCTLGSAAIAEREEDFGRMERLLAVNLAALKGAALVRTPIYGSIAHEEARALLLGGRMREAWQAEQTLMAELVAAGRDDGEAYFAMVNVGAIALMDGGQPREALALIERTAERALRDTPGASLPFYLDASRLLAAGWAGESIPVAGSLAALAARAEAEGLLSAVPMYRSAAVCLGLERGALTQAEEDLRALKQYAASRDRLLARSDELRERVAEARLDVARGDPAAALNALDAAARRVAPPERATERLWSQVLLARAAAELAAQDPAAALETARAAGERTGREAIDPHASRWTGEALLLEGQAESALGRREAARRLGIEALQQLQSSVAPTHPLASAAQRLSAT